MMDSNTPLSDDTLWAIREAERARAAVFAAEYNRHTIVMNGADAAEYFTDDMSEADKLAMKRYLIYLGKASWAWPDLR